VGSSRVLSLCSDFLRTCMNSKETDAPELATFNLGDEDLSDDPDFECEINELMLPDPLDLDPDDCEQENEELQRELKELADELLEWSQLTNQTLVVPDALSPNNSPEKEKSPMRRPSLRGNYRLN